MSNPKVRNFPELIRWIADHHHDGAVLPIAQKVDVSPALTNLWVKGQVKNPTIGNIQGLCSAYNLDFMFVVGLVNRRKPISGGSASTLLLPVDQRGEPPEWSPQAVVETSMISRLCGDIMLSRSASRLWAVAQRMQLAYISGGEAQWAYAA